jgi:hypothetical protein
VYYHIFFTVDKETKTETIIKANSEKEAKDTLRNYWKNLNSKIRITKVEESKYLNEE